MPVFSSKPIYTSEPKLRKIKKDAIARYLINPTKPSAMIQTGLSTLRDSKETKESKDQAQFELANLKKFLSYRKSIAGERQEQLDSSREKLLEHERSKSTFLQVASFYKNRDSRFSLVGSEKDTLPELHSSQKLSNFGLTDISPG